MTKTNRRGFFKALAAIVAAAPIVKALPKLPVPLPVPHPKQVAVLLWSEARGPIALVDYVDVTTHSDFLPFRKTLKTLPRVAVFDAREMNRYVGLPVPPSGRDIVVTWPQQSQRIFEL